MVVVHPGSSSSGPSGGTTSGTAGEAGATGEAGGVGATGATGTAGGVGAVGGTCSCYKRVHPVFIIIIHLCHHRWVLFLHRDGLVVGDVHHWLGRLGHELRDVAPGAGAARLRDRRHL